jgi:ankyrin repeat protein
MSVKLLVKSIRDQDLGKVKSFLKSKDVSKWVNKPLDAEGNACPLHIAAGVGFDGATALLLEAKADPNTVDGSGQTPLHCATSGKAHNVMKQLLGYLSDAERASQLQPLISLSISIEDPVGVKLLIDAKASVSEQAFYEAAQKGLDTFKSVYESADCDCHATVLHAAAQSGQLDTVNYLLQHHTTFSTEDLNIALHRASRHGDATLIQRVLDANADVNSDINATSPLFHAIDTLKPDAVQLLISKNANVNFVSFADESPKTLYAVAAEMPSEWQHRDQVVAMLLEANADPNV